jgi:hypothetical protein
MNILLTALWYSDRISLQKELRERRHIVEYVPFDRVLGYIKFSPGSPFAAVDAIVCLADSDMLPTEMLDHALALAAEVRQLADSCCMRDGRKWKSIPFVLICHLPYYFYYPGEFARHDVSIIRPGLFSGDLISRIKEEVDQYVRKILADYQQLGVMFTFERGKCKVRPALKLKQEKAESAYYHAQGDRRKRDAWVTVMRDREAIESDISIFEELINSGVSERQMQTFFEENPMFLSQLRYRVQVPHPSYKRNRWSPDFAFTSILGISVDEDIDLLELKGPAEELLNSHNQHPGFTSQLHKAIDQVRDYGEHVNHPDNHQKMLKQFGHIPSSGNLAVVLGKDHKDEGYMEQFRRRQRYVPDVEVITYTKILQAQEEQLRHLKAPTTALIDLPNPTMS